MFQGSMVAVATPMQIGNAPETPLDKESLAGLVEFHIENKTDAIVAVGTTGETKVLPIQNSELLRLNIGTAPVLSKVSNVKSNKIQVELRRPVCIFEGENVAISRRIAERWRLIGAGIVG